MKNMNEFIRITNDILDNDEFKKLKFCNHHKITRYEHCFNVAFLSYKVSKLLKLDNYKEITRAALLHDFYTNEVDGLSNRKKLRKHPKIALKNANKYFKLNGMQKDIIVNHMYPVTKTIPKYKETYLVDLIDDYSAIKEILSYKCKKLLINIKNIRKKLIKNC